MIMVKLGGKSGFIIPISQAREPTQRRKEISLRAPSSDGSQDPNPGLGPQAGSPSGVTLPLLSVLDCYSRIHSVTPQLGPCPQDAGSPKSSPASGQAQCLGSSQSALEPIDAQRASRPASIPWHGTVCCTYSSLLAEILFILQHSASMPPLQELRRPLQGEQAAPGFHGTLSVAVLALMTALHENKHR